VPHWCVGLERNTQHRRHVTSEGMWGLACHVTGWSVHSQRLSPRMVAEIDGFQNETHGVMGGSLPCSLERCVQIVGGYHFMQAIASPALEGAGVATSYKQACPGGAQEVLVLRLCASRSIRVFVKAQVGPNFEKFDSHLVLHDSTS
jgi:hypothetical protein